MDNKKRFLSRDVPPPPGVTTASEPIEVVFEHRTSPPPLSYEQEGWAVAWTRSTVLILWVDLRGKKHAAWWPAHDVRRRTGDAGAR
jgi:hypothetical protein